MPNLNSPDKQLQSPSTQRKQGGGGNFFGSKNASSFFGNRNTTPFFGNGKVKQRFFGAKPTIVQRDETTDNSTIAATVTNKTNNLANALDYPKQVLLLSKFKTKIYALKKQIEKKERVLRNAAREANKAHQKLRGLKIATDLSKKQSEIQKMINKLEEKLKIIRKSLGELEMLLGNNQFVIKTIQKLLPVLGKATKVLENMPLDKIGPAATAINKLLTSDATTDSGKVADATLSSAVDALYSKVFPLTSAIDGLTSLVGLGQLSISDTLSVTNSSIVGVGEAIITGDESGLVKLHEKMKKSENKIVKTLNFLGEFNRDHGGAESAEKFGNFFGGSDTTMGRIGGFIGAIPGPYQSLASLLPDDNSEKIDWEMMYLDAQLRALAAKKKRQ
jgi:hypothetical protein